MKQSWPEPRGAGRIHKTILVVIYALIALYGLKLIGPSHEATERYGISIPVETGINVEK